MGLAKSYVNAELQILVNEKALTFEISLEITNAINNIEIVAICLNGCSCAVLTNIPK